MALTCMFTHPFSALMSAAGASGAFAHTLGTCSHRPTLLWHVVGMSWVVAWIKVLMMEGVADVAMDVHLAEVASKMRVGCDPCARVLLGCHDIVQADPGVGCILVAACSSP